MNVEPRFVSREISVGDRVVAVKARVDAPVASEPMEMALKAVDAEEGVLIFKISKAGNFDREQERVTLPALKAATYELVRNIGHDACEVDINHDAQAIKCDILQAWCGFPMPDEHALYVSLRPHDKSIVEAAKAGHIVGASWSGGYRLKDAVQGVSSA